MPERKPSFTLRCKGDEHHLICALRVGIFQFLSQQSLNLRCNIVGFCPSYKRDGFCPSYKRGALSMSTQQVVSTTPVEPSTTPVVVEEEQTVTYCGPLTCLCAACCWFVYWPCTILALCCPCDETQIKKTRRYIAQNIPR